MINKDKKDRVVRQFVIYCRMALRYEKINYYNERKRMAERESHMEMFSDKQLETIDKIFDTYHADYFYVMGYEIGIVDGDLAQDGRTGRLGESSVWQKALSANGGMIR